MIDATVIIAAWNAADTIERSLYSALNQQGLNIQVVVVDDASEQDFSDLIPSRDNVVYHRLLRNGGPAAARNAAISLAKGEWICVLDSDDRMKPDRLKRMITEAKRLNADVLLGNFQKVYEDAVNLTDEPFLEPGEVSKATPVSLARYVSENSVSKNSKSIGYLKPLIRHSFIKEHLLKYNERLRNGEDCHLIFEALAEGANVYIWPRTDYLYTVRQGSISYRIDPDHFEALIAEDRAFLQKYLDKIDPKAAMLLRRRETGLRKMMESERALAALKSRKFGAALGHLYKHPYALPMTGRQLAEAIGKRLR